MTLRLNGEEIGGVVEISGQPIDANVVDTSPSGTLPKPYLFGIAEGDVANHFGLNKFGHNTDVGGTL